MGTLEIVIPFTLGNHFMHTGRGLTPLLLTSEGFLVIIVTLIAVASICGYAGPSRNFFWSIGHFLNMICHPFEMAAWLNRKWESKDRIPLTDRGSFHESRFYSSEVKIFSEKVDKEHYLALCAYCKVISLDLFSNEDKTFY